MKKLIDKFDLTVLIIIIVILVIVAAALMFSTSDENISCVVNSTNTSITNQNITLHIYARGENTTINGINGLKLKEDHYELEVDKNQAYIFYVTNGKATKSCSINVNNIDKEPPTGKITASTNNKKTVLKITGEDNMQLSSSPYSWDGKTWSTINTLTVTKNGMYKGYLKDEAGNITTISYKYNKNSSTKTSETTEKLTINKGSSQNLKVSNGTVKSWVSNNSNIAAIDSNGKVTAKMAGTATITATLINGENHYFVITVKDSTVAVTGISLDKATAEMLTNGTLSLKIASVTPNGASCNKTTWTSNNTNIATVDSSGKVTAKAAGSATITANCDGVKATSTITVKAIVSNITFNKTSISLTVNQSEKLVPTVTGNVDLSLTWGSSNTGVATVDQNGNVKGIAAGSATITATIKSTGKKATCTVTVSNPITFKKYTNGTKKYEFDSATLKVYMVKETLDSYGSFFVTSIWASNPRLQLKKAISKSGSSMKPKNVLEFDINGSLTSKIAIGFNASAASSHNNFDKTYDGSVYIEPTPLMIYNGVVKYNLMKQFSNKEWEYSLPINYINKSNNLVSFHPPTFKTASELTAAYNTAIAEAYNTMTFGPMLVQNGKSLSSGLNYSWDAARLRQVLCQVDDHNYRIITSEGGKIRLNALADKMVTTYGCKNAINLDGGGSVALLYKQAGTNTFTYVNSAPDNGNYRNNKTMMYFTE